MTAIGPLRPQATPDVLLFSCRRVTEDSFILVRERCLQPVARCCHLQEGHMTFVIPTDGIPTVGRRRHSRYRRFYIEGVCGSIPE
jgi:hypothetical protein